MKAIHTSRIFGVIAVCALLAGCSRNSGTGMGGAGAAADDQYHSSDKAVNTPSATTHENSAGSLQPTDTNAAPIPAPPNEPDNTRENARDRSGATLTPGDQGGSDSDRQLTRQIRRAIVSNDQLSTEAKNIKIITQNGKVTLRGPVKSEQEKQAVASAAQNAAGGASVDNLLEVTNQ